MRRQSAQENHEGSLAAKTVLLFCRALWRPVAGEYSWFFI
jgi:hypothetical protein